METDRPTSVNYENRLMNRPAQRYQKIVAILRSVGKRVRVEEGENILCEGGNCNFFFYVESGTFRAIRWVGDREVTIGFIFPGELVMCPFSFMNFEPNDNIIEALGSGEVIKVHRKDFEDIVRNQPAYSAFVNYLLSSYIEGLLNKLAEFKAHTAEKIYLDLLNQHPSELKGIPLMYIASYLGVSQERLSRIRKKHPHLI